jgi:hypothetical protein
MAVNTVNNLLPPAFYNESEIPRSLEEEFPLCENGNIVFHWADCHETCESIKQQLTSESILKDDFKRREDALARHRLIPVWIRTKKKVYQLTMFDLYERYILNQGHQIGDLDPVSPIELSFISGTGPFKEMAISECFSEVTYRDFVMVYLLKGKLTKRDYRVRVKAKVLVEYGDDYTKARLINLEQMSSTGLLFSADSDFYMYELSQNRKLRILVETNTLKQAIGKNIKDLQKHLSQHTFNFMYSSRKEDALECSLDKFVVESSFDFLRKRKVYLFISYEQLAKQHKTAAKVLSDFTTYTRDLVREHYQQISIQVKTA